MGMSYQEYECEKCGVESHVPLFKGEGAYAVILRIEADHLKWSPECDNPVSSIKVLKNIIEQG